MLNVGLLTDNYAWCMSLNCLVDMANVVISGPYHPTFSFRYVCLNLVPSTKPHSRWLRMWVVRGKIRSHVYNLSHYVGTRQRFGRDTDVKSCTHAHNT